MFIQNIYDIKSSSLKLNPPQKKERNKKAPRKNRETKSKKNMLNFTNIFV